MENNDPKQTHIATTPNQRPPLPIEEFRQQLKSQYIQHVTNYFRGDKKNAAKFMTAVISSVQKIPALLACDRESLITAFMCAAELELYPTGVSGEAYVIPYKGKAQFQLGYQGFITLFFRAGVQSLRANIVYEKDVFEYEEGLEPKLVHKPDPFIKDRGAPKGAYAIAVVNGQSIFKVMSKDEIMEIKEFSQSKDSKFTPWDRDNDPELWMWKKTVIKQLGKLLPKNETINRAISADNADSVIEARRANLNAEGPAVGRAFHNPNPPKE